jgi:Glu-tRNA(Gln) amidotransferase subunit E-like FAD-binding protein
VSPADLRPGVRVRLAGIPPATAATFTKPAHHRRAAALIGRAGTVLAATRRGVAVVRWDADAGTASGRRTVWHR